MLRGAVNHIYDLHLNGVVLLGHLTSKIHLHLQKMYQHLNRQGAELVLEAPKHVSLIKRPTWDHVTIWKIYISIFMRFIAKKLVRLLTLGRVSSTQTLKSSPSSCFFTFFPPCHFFWTDCHKPFSECFKFTYQENVWPRSESFLGQTKRYFCTHCSWSCYLRRAWHMLGLCTVTSIYNIQKSKRNFQSRPPETRKQAIYGTHSSGEQAKAT